MSLSKTTGGILLIIGTSIGGGMLALPVATSAAGMFNSLIFLVGCWFVMTAGALLMLEVNVSLPAGSNIISMAKSTMGLPGQIIAWICYLVLLYALLSAYISGGSDVLGGLLDNLHLHLPTPLTTLLFTGCFSLIVYAGIRTVDYVNRTLMFGKLGIYVLLILIISPHIDLSKLNGGAWRAITGSLMILITSFGFASIVPSLRAYFDEDIKSLRKVIVIGSFIPLICYILWNAVIMGVIEQHKLTSIANSEHAISGLTQALNTAIHSPQLMRFFELFTSICMLTAFLAVSLGLFDFLADGLHLKKGGKEGILTLLLTFAPPLLIVLIYPGIYLYALSYAGICCVILLLLLPTFMAYKNRTMSSVKHEHFIPGGHVSLIILGIIGIMLLGLNFIS